MLTSAGGILALLKDQNQVKYRLLLIIINKSIILKHVYSEC